MSQRSPEPEATHLIDQIKAEILRDGPIGIDRYMTACLADPQFGYYLTRDPLGRGGDFTTAPEISQIFGEMIGLWCVAVWQQLGQPNSFRLIELGPGRGTLMADALRAMRVLPDCRAAARVDLVEISPILRARQAETLSRHHSDVAATWHHSFEEIPGDLPRIIIANEFFDALPIHQWVRRDGAWRERLVGIADDGLVFVDGPLSDPSIMIEDAEEGAIGETGEARDALASRVASSLVATTGVCLVIDYGAAASGLGESLQAIKEHRYVPVLEDCGVADLTAHVDFAALSSAFARGGAAVHGPISQAQFLTRLGAGTRAERLMRDKDPAMIATISQGLRRLLDPMAMGSLFKVLAVGSKALGPLPGFEP